MKKQSMLLRRSFLATVLLSLSIQIAFANNVESKENHNKSFLVAKKEPVKKSIQNISELKNIEFIKQAGDFFIVSVNEKLGVIDEKGNLLIEPQFDEIGDFFDGLAPASINGKCGIINKKGDFVLKPKYQKINYLDNGLYSAKLNGKFGMINRKGDFIVEPKYDNLFKQSSSFKPNTEKNLNLYRIKLKNKVGLINEKGKIIVEPKFDLIYPFQANIAKFELNKKMGLIDKTGKVLVDAKYDDITYSKDKNDKLAIIELNGKFGVNNITGKVIVEPKYDYIVLSKYNIVCIIKEKSGFTDKNGKEVINRKFSAFDQTGKVILEPKYEIIKFNDKTGVVKINNKYGIVNEKGEFILEPKFDAIDPFNGFINGIITAELNNKWGAINKNGEFVIEPKYDDLYFGSPFLEGMGAFSINHKYGIIDKNGKIIIENNFDYIYYFTKDLKQPKNDILFSIGINEKSDTDIKEKNKTIPKVKIGIVDITGKIRLEPIFDEINTTSDDNLIVKLDGKYGIMDLKGNTLIEKKYTDAKELAKGVIILSDDNNSYFVNTKLNINHKLSNKLQTNSNIDQLKANMHIFQTMLETYAVDHKGMYPKNISELIKEAKENKFGSYYKNLKNPFDEKLDGLVDKGANIKGSVIYAPIKDSKGNITIYKIFANDKTGHHLKDTGGEDFCLSNN